MKCGGNTDKSVRSPLNANPAGQGGAAGPLPLHSLVRLCRESCVLSCSEFGGHWKRTGHVEKGEVHNEVCGSLGLYFNHLRKGGLEALSMSITVADTASSATSTLSLKPREIKQLPKAESFVSNLSMGGLEGVGGLW